jgi:hypothetical protein
MTDDPILHALSRTEDLLTTYLRDTDDGILNLMSIHHLGALQMVTAGLLEFIAAQYKMQMVDQLAAGQPVDLSLETTLTAIHIGFMELRNDREQDLGGNTQPIPEEGPQ